MLLLGAALLVGGAQTAGAGTLIFLFSDDGTKSTINARGSLNLSGFNYVDGTNSTGDNNISLGDSLRQWGIPHNRYDYPTARYRFGGSLQITGKSSYTGNGAISVSDYGSNISFSLWESRFIRARTSNISNNVLKLDGKKAEFSGTLSSVLNDDSFYVEFAYGSEIVIFAAKPVKPSNLTTTSGPGKVTLNWANPSNITITKYQYQQKLATATEYGAWQDIDGSSASTTSHTVTRLIGDTGYDFRIRAVNAAGNGVESDKATVTTEPGPSPDAQRRVLKHALAAIAQTTVDGAADMLGQRFDATPGAQGLTLAGQRVGGEAALSAAEGNRWDGIDRWDSRTSSRSQAVSDSALLGGSAFTLPLAAAGSEGASGGPAWTVWGRGDWRGFEGRRSGESWDGKQRTGWLGVDGRLNDRLMAGVAVSRGEGEADYRLNEFEGRLETSLTALWPYLQMKTAGGGAVRLVLGAGAGEAEHRAFDGTVEKADLSMLAGSVSGRMPVARQSDFTLSAIGGASLAQIETDGSSSTSSLGGLKATSWRLRAGMEAEHDGFALSSGSEWQVRPRGALALRQDGGDGVTGTGMEVSAGMRLSAPGSRFGLDASGHWLALHSEDGAQEWGASLEARLNPAADGRGLSLALGPAWGQQQDGALTRERLFDEERNAAPQHLSLTARAGYGFAAAGGLLTPFADMALGGESRTQRYRTGVGFARGGIDAALTAGHRAGGEPDTRIGMDLRLNF